MAAAGIGYEGHSFRSIPSTLAASTRVLPCHGNPGRTPRVPDDLEAMGTRDKCSAGYLVGNGVLGTLTCG